MPRRWMASRHSGSKDKPLESGLGPQDVMLSLFTMLSPMTVSDDLYYSVAVRIPMACKCDGERSQFIPARVRQCEEPVAHVG